MLLVLGTVEKPLLFPQSENLNPFLSGGVKVNFRFNSTIRVANRVTIGEFVNDFVTSFRFSGKSVLVVPVTDKV